MSKRKTRPDDHDASIPTKEKAPRVTLEKTDFNHIKFSHSQLNFFKTIKKSFITVCTGPAGTAKTFVACYAALDSLREGTCKKIILTRPAVESGENLGFLPGSVEEKIAPYMQVYFDNMEKILTNTEKIKLMIERKQLLIEPVAFMRGKTFDDTIVILDEAQNADLRQLMLVTTRLGNNSSIVVCGDVTQWDLKARKKDLLIYADNIVKGTTNCNLFQFTREDIVRNPILVELTDKYEAYKAENKLD